MSGEEAPLQRTPLHATLKAHFVIPGLVTGAILAPLDGEVVVRGDLLNNDPEYKTEVRSKMGYTPEEDEDAGFGRKTRK